MTVINSDKYPANYGVIFYGSEVISVFNFVVGTCALCADVRFYFALSKAFPTQN